MLSYDMKVVGETSQQYAEVASQKRKFRINEILIIEDSELGPVKGEVIQTKSRNYFIPSSEGNGKASDDSVFQSLSEMGFTIDEGEVNTAKVRMLTELLHPVRIGSNVRLPEFNEIEKMLIKDKNGWNVGVLRGTEEISNQMPEELQNKGALFYPDSGIIPYNSVPFLFDYKSMYEYPHIGIFGGSGSGKSFGSRVLEEEIMKCRIPALVGDPHYEKDFKDYFPDMPEEYKRSFSNRYEVLTVGKEIGIPFEELSANDLINLLSASSSLTDNMDTAVRQLFRYTGETLGTFSEKVNVLSEFLENRPKWERIFANIEELDHDEQTKVKRKKEIADEYGEKVNYQGVKGIQWRLNRLIGYQLFDKGSREVFESLRARKLVVIRGSIEHLKLFFSYVLKKTYDIRREYIDSKSQDRNVEKEYFPPFITVLDEAHNFAPKAFDSPTKQVIKEIAQEGRKYGSFLIFATQRPALLDDTIMAQLNTKFLFRTVRGQDISSLAEETDLTSADAERLPYLPSGECFVSSAVIGRTVAIRVRCAITTSPNSTNPFDELEQFSISETNPLTEGILEKLPFQTKDLLEVLKFIERKYNVRSSRNEMNSHLEELEQQDRIIVEDTVFGKNYKRKE